MDERAAPPEVEPRAASSSTIELLTQLRSRPKVRQRNPKSPVHLICTMQSSGIVLATLAFFPVHIWAGDQVRVIMMDSNVANLGQARPYRLINGGPEGLPV